MSNSQCKTFLFGKRSYKTWQEKEIVRLSGAADEQSQHSDSGTYIAHGPVKDRPWCVGTRVAGEAGSGGQGGAHSDFEELMTRPGQGVEASWIGNA